VKRLPPFLSLRALEAAARHKSYSRAAEELSVTHGAVSQQIRRLEEELGAPLFERRGNRMEPTPEAVRLAQEIGRALGILHSGVTAFTGAAELDPLVLSVGGHVGRRWLPPRLSRLVAGPAGAGLEIRVEDRHADLAHERVDVGIRYGTGDWDGLACHRLLVERTFPVCSPELAASHNIQRPADLLKLRLLHRDNRPWNLWFGKFGLEPPPRTGPVFDDSLLMVEGAAQGLGLALVVDGMVDEELRSGRLVRPLPEQFVSDLDMYMVWQPGSRKLARIHALRDWLLAEIAADQTANRGAGATVQVA
jgi:LysR family glycine cleavage system transcriptional activator